jgi:LemA protein
MIWVVLGIIVLLALILVFAYNGMVKARNKVDESWSGIDVQLKRRHDLIPNLVETVKGYATHEESVFKEIADSRSRLLAAKTPEETIAASNQQSSALGRLLAVAENYPNLKANEQFNRLMDELSGTENRLATERMRYNERIQEFNTQRRRFPSNMTAKVFGFKEYPYFTAPPEAQAVPKVNFGR